MHNVDLSQDDALEFPDLPHTRRVGTSSSLDSGELEVGKEFSNKDSFLSALKQHSIMNGVNYNVVKSKSNKFEAKCALQDGVSEDHPKMNSDMLATLILPTMKANPRTSVSVLVANMRSQLRLRRHVCPQPNICVISDRGTEIVAAIERQGSLWHRTHHRSHEGIIGRQYRLHLRNRTCDCGRFDALRYPCAHVIAACQNLRLDPMSYVDKV
ncbi:hypothetical protein PVK06_008625 [Gossypium arboreum]|uniref:SWIM-type domain-containing protein n=1 Tax=Gossypium arboreum TaxID=29729 RepID=A0ABR0QKD8_GOSAR|nr:hypothetical protein PVK06_008625 [Gossypium arboreum]